MDFDNATTLINYEGIYQQYDILSIPILAALLLFWFVILGTIAETLFVPNLTTVQYIYKIDEAVAGITLAAFANGAGDIFSTIAAFDNDLEPLAFGELIGAALFVSVFTCGIISLLFPIHADYSLAVDMFCFILGMAMWGAFLTDSTISKLEILFLFLFYGGYVVIVIIMSRHHQQPRDNAIVTTPTECSLKFNLVRRSSLAPLRGSEPASSAYSQMSLTGEDEFDPNYFQSNPQIRSSSFSRIAVSFQRRLSFNEPHTVEPENSDVIEDILNYTAADLDPPPVDWENEIRYTVQHLFPIVLVWHQLTVLSKIIGLVQVPAVLVLNATVPVIHTHHLLTRPEYQAVSLSEDLVLETETHEVDADYPRFLLLAQLLISPFLMACIKFSIHDYWFGMPVWFITILVGLLLACVAFHFTKAHPVIRYVKFLTVYGILESILIISSVTNELVELLRVLGLAFNLNISILGLTLFAAVNSIADLVANTAMARQGHIVMALSACVGTPLLNIILGTGIAALKQVLKTGDAVHFKSMVFSFWVSWYGLLISSSTGLLIFCISRFAFSKAYGYSLITMYLVTIIICISFVD
jgi:sodium/potassium/calcium exchanger 6